MLCGLEIANQILASNYYYSLVPMVMAEIHVSSTYMLYVIVRKL